MGAPSSSTCSSTRHLLANWNLVVNRDPELAIAGKLDELAGRRASKETPDRTAGVNRWYQFPEQREAIEARNRIKSKYRNKVDCELWPE